jgi:glucose-1-phosphate adenylyltransferase
VALQSIMRGGCIIAGGFVKDCVLGRNVFVDQGADIRDSILLDNVYGGKGARIQRPSIDKNVRVADATISDTTWPAMRSDTTLVTAVSTVVAKARDTLLTRSRDL